MATILLIDDSPEIHSSLRLPAREHDYELLSAYDSTTGLKLALDSSADIIILDVMIPEKNGFELCKEMRSQGCNTPVIFLTAKGGIDDKSAGYQAGGDDYLVKPFLSEELFMRISAILRRSEGANQVQQQSGSLEAHEDLNLGDLTIHFDQYVVEKNERNVKLTAKEFEIIRLLSSSPGSVFSREQIYQYLWNELDPVGLDSITVLIRRIRTKIEDDPSNPKHLLTVYRIGYKLV